MGSAPFRQAAGMNPLGMQNHGMPAQPGYFFPQQMGMSYAPPPMNMPSMQIPPFDPQQMQFMNPPRFYAAPPSAPVQAEAAKDPAAKTNADWALEKRR